MSEFRILDFNYVFSEPSLAITASSVDPSFPASNVSHFHRAKTWHSAGNFVVATTNRKINFKESGGGAELTATVATGTYTPTTLAAAIKTALEAAGASDYTVTHSTSTGKWTILSSGAFLSILWSTGTDVANSLAPSIGFAASDLTGSVTYTGSTVALHTEEWLVFDLAATAEIDSFAILFDRFAGSGLSSSATLRLQANSSNSWASPSVDQALSIDADYDVVTHFFSTGQSYRYWRLKIVDAANPNLYVSIPTVFLSKATQLAQTPQMGFTQTRRDLSKHSRTAYGHKYSDVYPTLRVARFAYANLVEADVETLELIFERVGSVTPIMLCLDPTAETFDKDRFCIYGYLGEDLSAENQFYTYFNTALSLEEAM